ncbi:porin family protein [Pedobacter sp. SL55]|uniref:porin family protein n=1 Tax=Pedobacter sp. SL55 TaxID=2995161 RepID=UPI002270A23E|nr:porin family protein [Pedobacter sp. SL55]WAC41170.1 porin family protein [Pedobacter sp. SL55]
MKKIILLGSALLLSSSALFAQTTTTMSGSDARIGIKGGVNLSTVKYSGFDGASTLNDATKQNVGYNFTVFGDFGVGNNFFIQPGVSLQNKGTKFEGNFAGITGEQTINVMAIEVPVNAVVRIPTGQSGAFHLSAGPYAAFNVDGKRKTKITSGTNQGTTEESLKFGNNADDDVASMDFGANFGVGYRMNNGFLLGANYGLGLSNVLPKDNRSGDTKGANRVWGFSVGYSF